MRSLVDLLCYDFCCERLLLQMQGDCRINADGHLVKVSVLFAIELVELTGSCVQSG